MKTSLKTALVFLAVAGLTGTSFASDRRGGPGNSAMERFEKADTDESGDVSFDEFSKAAGERFAGADANGDGKMTVAEIADEIMRQRALRRAKRIVERFDINGDGELTQEEITSRQRKQFALMDRNDDGKIAREELPRRGFGHRGKRHRHRHHD